jgi:hypothetical protein
MLKTNLKSFSIGKKESLRTTAYLDSLFGVLDGLFNLETYADERLSKKPKEKLDLVLKVGLLREAVGNIFKTLKKANMDYYLDQFEKSRVTTPQARTTSETPATSENPIKTTGWRQLLHHASSQTKTEEVA